jgi:hypothetical protein
VAKRSPKPRNLNALAASIVGDATDEKPPEPESAHVEAGRCGGRRARAEELSPEKRAEVARKPAAARLGRRS